MEVRVVVFFLAPEESEKQKQITLSGFRSIPKRTAKRNKVKTISKDKSKEIRKWLNKAEGPKITTNIRNAEKYTTVVVID